MRSGPARRDDALTGGAGDDTLAGGAGADKFIYADGFGDDIIVDFGVDDWRRDRLCPASPALKRSRIWKSSISRSKRLTPRR